MQSTEEKNTTMDTSGSEPQQLHTRRLHTKPKNRLAKARKFKPPQNLLLNTTPLEESDGSRITESGKFEIENIAKFGPDGIQMLEQPDTAMTPVSPSMMDLSPISPGQTSFSPSTTQTGSQYDNYEIKGKLGSGASASVKRVVHKKTGEVFAMKQVLIDKNEMKPKVIVTEFKALYKTSCPYVITLYDAFYREGSILMILEYMNCGSLEDVLKTCGKIPEGVLSKMTKQMLLGLKYLHEEKKIIHRDIKPANILVNTKGILKIADFGMAGMKEQTSMNTKPVFETFQGTFTYMSPERIKGMPHSFDSDLWSIGLTVAQCALGYFPFELKEKTIWEMMKNLEDDFINNIPKDKISKELLEFIDSCMKFNPKDRATIDQLLSSEFITKHEKTSPSVGRWLHENFVKKKKQEKAAREKKKQ